MTNAIVTFEVYFAHLGIYIEATVTFDHETNCWDVEVTQAVWDGGECPEYLYEMIENPDSCWLKERPVTGENVPLEVLDSMRDAIEEMAIDEARNQ